MRRRSLAVALAGLMLALMPALALYGFTVDDALITARYAHHLATGAGYRFNASGPITDGVTPLGWAFVLSPFAHEGPLQALSAAKGLGVAAWALAASVLAVAVDRIPGRSARLAALALIPASAPLGAWSAAGMETGVVTALGAFSVALPVLGSRRMGAACAGIAAALRPELLPFALVVAVAAQSAEAPRRMHAVDGTAIRTESPLQREARETHRDRNQRPQSSASSGARDAGVALALAALPFAAVALLRTFAFGRAAPLSALAKPPDASLGTRYALACLLLTGPVVLIAPLAWRALGRYPLGLLAAIAVHFFAVAAAGGDWMPLSRLVVPVLPAVVLSAAFIAAVADARASALRLALALGGELFVTIRIGPTAASVGANRLRVVDELRGALDGARAVAALDIGWLGAATAATVVDLAGVTDPAIAALPGGHTTKRIPVGLFETRAVDALVLLLAEGEAVQTPWTASHFARGVEQYVASFPHIEEEFAPVAVSAVPHLGYVVLRRRTAARAAP